ncbi:putative membrane protein [Aeromicrobium marinum DSM 15272]|uniref:Membrane protein n=1 Tax=Aeromicrobium marinum DSM 15272 TaxID=585531 RepID=E2SFD2_9ACTN|nr:EamA family transporter [Aeromicrobium marinum]EFQ82033.1 putative membrane protein [Aeromicrobium marinum DSM 15272]
MTSRSPRLGYLLVVAAAVLFGVNAGVSRIPLRSGTPTDTFTSVRITAALAVLVLVAVAVDRAALRPPRGRSLLLVVGLGLVGVTGVQWTYNVAINRLPLGIALLLEYLGPVLVVLWVRFVRSEPVAPRMWPALGLAVLGLAVVSRIWSGLEFDGLGVAMALLAAVCFATYFLLGERGVDADSPLQVIVWSFAAATVVMNLVQPVWTADALGADASALGRFDEVVVPAWAAMGWVVVLGTVAPFFLLLVALRMLSATIVSVVAMLEPVVAALVGWGWFRETLTPLQILGMAMVLSGVVLAQTSRRSEPAPLPPPT